MLQSFRNIYKNVEVSKDVLPRAYFKNTSAKKQKGWSIYAKISMTFKSG